VRRPTIAAHGTALCYIQHRDRLGARDAGLVISDLLIDQFSAMSKFDDESSMTDSHCLTGAVNSDRAPPRGWPAGRSQFLQILVCAAGGA